VVARAPDPGDSGGLVAEEAEQRSVDLVGVGPGDAVRAALDHDEFHVGDQGSPLK
jgi:hypothetical protein